MATGRRRELMAWRRDKRCRVAHEFIFRLRRARRAMGVGHKLGFYLFSRNGPLKTLHRIKTVVSHAMPAHDVPVRDLADMAATQ